MTLWPCEVLWVTLKTFSVPDLWQISLMKDTIIMYGELLNEIWVNNGLRQDCTMDLTLFNL